MSNDANNAEALKMAELQAEAYTEELLKQNPNGFTVATYVNSDTITDAWLAGYNAKQAEASKEHKLIMESVERQRQLNDAQSEKLKKAEGLIWYLEGRFCLIRNRAEHYKDKDPCSSVYQEAELGISRIEKFRKGAG